MPTTEERLVALEYIHNQSKEVFELPSIVDLQDNDLIAVYDLSGSFLGKVSVLNLIDKIAVLLSLTNYYTKTEVNTIVNDAKTYSINQVVGGASSNFDTLKKLEDELSYYKSDTDVSISDINSILNLKADLVNGVIPANQLPSFVDDVHEYSSVSLFPVNGESGKVYLDTTENKQYRWGGTSYVLISEGVVLGETIQTAYRGDRGKIAFDHGQETGNPHNLTYSQLLSIPSDIAKTGDIPTNNNQLQNGAGYITLAEVPELLTQEDIDYIYDNMLVSSDLTVSSGSNNLLRPEYIMHDHVLSSAGLITPYNGFKVIKQPVTEGEDYTFSGIFLSNTRHWCYLDDQEQLLGSTTIYTGGNISVTPPTGAAYLVVVIYEPNSVYDYTRIMVNKGLESMYYEPYSVTVSAINGLPIASNALLGDAKVPAEPLTPFSAVPFKLLDDYVANSNLTITDSLNLASTLIFDMYINSAGNKVNGAAGWVTLEVDTEEGKSYTFGNHTISSSGYYAFYTDATKSSVYGNYTDATLPKTVTTPTGANKLFITIARPANTEADHNNVMVNEGVALLPYVSHKGVITEINGNLLSGFSESTEAVPSGLLQNLPTGNGAPPIEVEIGDSWIDTSTSNIKIRLV